MGWKEGILWVPTFCQRHCQPLPVQRRWFVLTCQAQRSLVLACRPGGAARCSGRPTPRDESEAYALLVAEVVASPHHAAIGLAKARSRAALVPLLQAEAVDLWAWLLTLLLRCGRLQRERDEARADVADLLERVVLR